jgi:hypothetical protein
VRIRSLGRELINGLVGFPNRRLRDSSSLKELAMACYELTDFEWKAIKPHLPDIRDELLDL